MESSDIRVYAKHLQTPSVIHQACIGNWSTESHEPPGEQPQRPGLIDIVFGKGSFLSMYRFVVHETDQEPRPTGSLELVHEQPVYGTIKDIKALQCTFEPEDDERQGTDMDIDHAMDKPRLGYVPRKASSTVLVATSDSGVLSFLTFYYNEGEDGTPGRGQFYILKEVEIAKPGFGYLQAGAKIAVDPTSQIMAVSGFQNHIKLVVLKNTKRSQFNPVERISNVDLKGTIIGMDFLASGSNDSAILAVLLHNKETTRYHITTFHIDLKNRLSSTLVVQTGASQINSSPSKSILLLKALPNIPGSMVYVDEEKITLVTVETSTDPGASNTSKHNFRTSLDLPKRDIPEGATEFATDSLPNDVFPLISACATPPPSPYPSSDQTLYLGSDTSELYRVNIQYLTLAMQFELISGDRPVGSVMQVLARHQFATLSLQADLDQEILLNTDYLVYSSDYGDGGILAIKEDEEEGIDLFAITEIQNSSPILDFCTREPSLPGRDSLYVCSGMKTEGSLKRIRSGLSIESSGSSGQQFFTGATGLWSIKANMSDAFDSFMVVSFIQSTKLMRSGEGGNLDDVVDGCGLDLTQPTVHSGRLKDGMIFQVHRSGVVAAEVAS
ncbi:hypothetical protein BGX34_000870, partial [Mortierella sp. NVP85]